jgi:hypothetical protein
MSIEWDEDKKDQLLKLLNETFYFHKDGSVTRRDEMPKYENREMIVSDFGGNAPCAYLFCNGAGMFFDEKGTQIHDLQCLGISGLHKFVQRYPEGEVHWAIWRKGSQLMDKELVSNLLRYLKEDVNLNDEKTENMETK